MDQTDEKKEFLERRARLHNEQAADHLHHTTDDIFTRAMVREELSMWIEDWSAVGRFLMGLRDANQDFLEHSVKYPDLYPKLFGQILVTDVNDVTLALMRTTDKQRLLGRLADVSPDSVFNFKRIVTAIARGDCIYRGEGVLRRLDGTRCDCLVTAVLPKDISALNRVDVYIFDITPYLAGRAGHNASAHAARVAVMGALTASIAHEVRNPLAAAVTHASAALRWLRRPVPELAEAETAIAAVIKDTDRAQEVVERTLSFVRNVAREAEAIDLKQVIRDAVVLVERDLQNHEVSVHLEFANEVPFVLADSVQLQQVLINLMMNAAQAMEETARPRRILIRLHHEMHEAIVEVADGGRGIDPARLDCLFDPFYSTRLQGLGMGLAICRNCVEAVGGRIWAHSEVGSGAQFFFTVPIWKADHAMITESLHES